MALKEFEFGFGQTTQKVMLPGEHISMMFLKEILRPLATWKKPHWNACAIRSAAARCRKSSERATKSALYALILPVHGTILISSSSISSMN